MENATSLYEQNLEAIREYISSEYYEFLSKKEPTDVCIKQQETSLGGSNLYINNSPLFPLSIEEFNQKQIETYFEKPLRVDFGKIPVAHATRSFEYLNKTSSTSLFNTYARLDDVIDYQQIQPITSGRLNAFTLIIGIGAAKHVREILERTNSKNLILCDYYIDILQASLETGEWEEIVHVIKSRGGRIYFLISDNSENLSIAATQVMKNIDHGLLPGSYIYSHYDLDREQRLLKYLSARFHEVKSYNGWIEDELVHLTNILRQLNEGSKERIEGKRYLYRNDPDFIEPVSKPICIVGSGPSIREFLPVLKENSEKIFVLSCGSSLKTLLEAGIHPDLHVELENVAAVYDLLSCIEDAKALKQIDLLASVTTNSIITEFFRDIYLFQREGSTSPRFLEDYVFPMRNSGRTAVNSGLTFALSMQPALIFLLGTDFAFGNDGAHHDKSVGYFSKNWKEKHEEFNDTEGHMRTASNGAGEVITKRVWNHMRYGIEETIRIQNRASMIYNCGEGARINGAIPLLSPEKMRTIIADGQIKSNDSLIDKRNCIKISQDINQAIQQDVFGFLECLDAFSQAVLESYNDLLTKMDGKDDLSIVEKEIDTFFEEIFDLLVFSKEGRRHQEILQSLLTEDIREFHHIIRHCVLISGDDEKIDVVHKLSVCLPYYLFRGISKFISDISACLEIEFSEAKTTGIRNITSAWLRWWDAIKKQNDEDAIKATRDILEFTPHFSWIIEEVIAWEFLEKRNFNFLSGIGDLIRDGICSDHHDKCVKCGKDDVSIIHAIQHNYFFFLISQCHHCGHEFFTRRFIHETLHENLEAHLSGEELARFVVASEEYKDRCY